MIFKSNVEVSRGEPEVINSINLGESSVNQRGTRKSSFVERRRKQDIYTARLVMPPSENLERKRSKGSEM